ncbi:MAG: hypothetical protein BWY75_03811 [bacterium ADurb.Bin425]|nr:MAG: hypothetical protein BWY75_03811 [bacterium ADurb.Bin425]
MRVVDLLLIVVHTAGKDTNHELGVFGRHLTDIQRAVAVGEEFFRFADCADISRPSTFEDIQALTGCRHLGREKLLG